MPDTTEARELELRDYLTVLRRRKWVVVVITLLVVGLALTASLLQTKTYRATAEVLLQPRASERIFTPENAGQPSNSQDRVDTEIQVMKSRSVRLAVAEALGSHPAISIVARGKTDVVAISSTSSDPAGARKAADLYAEVYIKTRRQQAIDDLLAAATQVQAKLSEIDGQIAAMRPDTESDLSSSAERQSLVSQRATYSQQLSQLQLAGNLTESGGAQLVSRAATPTSPFKPQPVRNGIMGLLLGLLFGSGFAFLREHLDDSVRTTEEVERVSGVSVLASIPVVRDWKERSKARVISLDQPTSAAAEAYRSLRTSIQFLRMDQSIRLIQITSSVAGEGKTATVANLGAALASAGHRVLLICCDLRRPRIHEFFGLSNTIGLTSVLVGDIPVAQAIQVVDRQPGLSVLASGPQPPNPSEILASPRMTELLSGLIASWDVVLLDSPPMLPVADASILSGKVDSTLVVVAGDRATRHGLGKTIELLNLVDAPVVGTVLNGGTDELRYGYTYGYAQRTSSKGATRSRRTRRRESSDLDERRVPAEAQRRS